MLVLLREIAVCCDCCGACAVWIWRGVVCRPQRSADQRFHLVPHLVIALDFDVRLHDLRHSFASFLVNQGVSLYVVQGLLGHTQARTTQRYAHLANDTLADAAEVVRDVILEPANNGATFRSQAAAST